MLDIVLQSYILVFSYASTNRDIMCRTDSYCYLVYASPINSPPLLWSLFDWRLTYMQYLILSYWCCFSTVNAQLSISATIFYPNIYIFYFYVAFIYICNSFSSICSFFLCSFGNEHYSHDFVDFYAIVSKHRIAYTLIVLSDWCWFALAINIVFSITYPIAIS